MLDKSLSEIISTHRLVIAKGIMRQTTVITRNAKGIRKWVTAIEIRTLLHRKYVMIILENME